MKRVFLTVLLLAGFSCIGMSQLRMSVGPVVGMNYNFLHGETINNDMSYNGVGVSIGGQADISFTPMWGLLATVTAYDMKNVSGTLTEEGMTTESKFGLSYLMINPAITFSVPNTKLGFFAGPGVGFKLSGTTEGYMVIEGHREDIPKADIPNMKPRVNGQVGAFYDFDFKGIYLTPYFLYDFGFTDVAKAAGWKVSGIKFGVAIKFGVIK
jgi:hypothetical protein